MGAKPTMLAATDPKAKANDYAGPAYMVEMRGPARWGRKVNKLAKNVEYQEAVWKKCEELAKSDIFEKV